MPFSIVPSHAVPVAARPVPGVPAVLKTHTNPQTPNPPFPVVFYDTVTVQSGGENAFRSENFKNNLGRPVELRGMRVMIQPLTNTGGIAFANSGVHFGGLLALEIEIDGVKVTRGAVPTWHLCRSDNRRNDNVFLSPIGVYSWYFSQPAPLLPGRGVKVQAKHLGDVTQSVQVHLSFAGRVSPAPIPRRIPFAASWISRAFGYTEVATDSAPPDALVNDTGHDLHVDRIIGRSIANDAGLLTGDLADYADATLQGVFSFQARLGLSQSRPILKTYTPWRTVFGDNAALETFFMLKPGDFLTADVKHLAGPTFTPALTSSQNRGSFSIVGWREV